MTLKEKITDLCKKRKISVRELERRADLKPRTVQHWDDSEPSAKKLYAVSLVLQAPIEELLSVYDEELSKIEYLNAIKKEKSVTQGDGKLTDYELAGLDATKREREIITRILNLPHDQQEAFLALTQSLQSNQ